MLTIAFSGLSKPEFLLSVYPCKRPIYKDKDAVLLFSDLHIGVCCDNFYNKASERALRYDSVDWLHNFTPNIDEFILSEKDKIHPTLETINQDYLFDYNINYYE